MLVKNRKTGVVLKATPRLVALAVRQSHFELIEDDDYVDFEEVRGILGAAKKAGEPGVEEVLKNLESVVAEKLAKRGKVTKAEPKPKPKAQAEPRTEPPKEPENTGDEGGEGEGGGDDDDAPITDEFSEVEAEVNSLKGGKKDSDHKTRLETLALENFGVNLDKRKSLADLKSEVLALIAEQRAE